MALLCPVAVNAAPLYLCKSYGSGTFWSNTHCGTQQATIERIVSVPDGMPFEMQVQLGDQAVREAARVAALAQQAPAQNSAQPTKSERRHDECRTLDERIARLDSLARQPQSASTQDRIAERRRQARDRQFQLRCR